MPGPYHDAAAPPVLAPAIAWEFTPLHLFHLLDKHGCLSCSWRAKQTHLNKWPRPAADLRSTADAAGPTATGSPGSNGDLVHLHGHVWARQQEGGDALPKMAVLDFHFVLPKGNSVPARRT